MIVGDEALAHESDVKWWWLAYQISESDGADLRVPRWTDITELVGDQAATGR